MDFASTTRAAEDMTSPWKGIVVNSIVVPTDFARSWDILNQNIFVRCS